MNAPDKLPPETRQPVSGYLWGALAVLTCPCHLPITLGALALLFGGTMLGAMLRDHPYIAGIVVTLMKTPTRAPAFALPLLPVPSGNTPTSSPPALFLPPTITA